MFGFFLTIAGLIIGHGAVTVIDTLGFLGQRSKYWTETTIRTHKVTKPLIWVGMIIFTIGILTTYSMFGYPVFFNQQIALISIMILNGIFLSFYISPRLLKLEQEGKSRELLPAGMQRKIFVSFLLSLVCWWGNVLLLALYISTLI